MKYIPLITLTIAAVMRMVSQEACSAQTFMPAARIAPTAPIVKSKTTFKLTGEPFASVARLVFSPNGRYLAALVDSSRRRVADIIVWDLLQNKEQARISNLPYFAFPFIRLNWSPDGRYITLGIGTRWPMQIWDPMTGAVVKELAVVGGIPSVYNYDGSKLLVNTTPLIRFRPTESTFRIYNTGTWSFEDFSSGGLIIETCAWTADGKVLLAGEWPRESVGRVIDGIKPEMSDALVRKIDPSGAVGSKTVILRHGVPVKGRPGLLLSDTSVDVSTSDAKGDLVALGTGNVTILDTNALKPTFIYSASEAKSKDAEMPSGALDENVALSADGEYLFIAGDRGGKSFILDAHSGTVLSRFAAGDRGLAVSRDGHLLALGDGRSVHLFSILKN